MEEVDRILGLLPEVYEAIIKRHISQIMAEVEKSRLERNKYERLYYNEMQRADEYEEDNTRLDKEMDEMAGIVNSVLDKDNKMKAIVKAAKEWRIWFIANNRNPTKSHQEDSLLFEAKKLTSINTQEATE